MDTVLRATYLTTMFFYFYSEKHLQTVLTHRSAGGITSVNDFFSAGPSRDGTIGEDTIRASLISAVSDKLRWRMKEEMDRAQAELNALKRTEEDLKKGHQKLEEMVTRLDQEVVSRMNALLSMFVLKKKKKLSGVQHMLSCFLSVNNFCRAVSETFPFLVVTPAPCSTFHSSSGQLQGLEDFSILVLLLFYICSSKSYF